MKIKIPIIVKEVTIKEIELNILIDKQKQVIKSMKKQIKQVTRKIQNTEFQYNEARTQLDKKYYGSM